MLILVFLPLSLQSSSSFNKVHNYLLLYKFSNSSSVWKWLRMMSSIYNQLLSVIQMKTSLINVLTIWTYNSVNNKFYAILKIIIRMLFYLQKVYIPMEIKQYTTLLIKLRAQRNMFFLIQLLIIMEIMFVAKYLRMLIRLFKTSS